jgi:hypothetical protein
MKLYKYWAAGEAMVPDVHPWKVRAFGGSDISMDEARRLGRERAERAAQALVNGRAPGSYGYGERPLREEIVKEIRNGDSVTAVISRNAYGCLVLNTNHIMFVDVDIYPASGDSLSFGESLRRIWDVLRGKGEEAKLARKREREQQILGRFDEVCRSQPELAFRIYRTYGGFRLLVTSGTYDPMAAETLKLLEALGSDPLYIRLCKAQECFRARLSAKFWRCGANRPPSRFPWEDQAEERQYREWEEDYHRLANTFAVCELVGSKGSSAIDETVRPILETHDRLTMQAGATLA